MTGQPAEQITGDSLLWVRGRGPEKSTSYWWSVCHDCPHRAAHQELRMAPELPGAHALDGGLLLAALDLAEHHGETGHRRGVLWTGEQAQHRPPTEAELAVCPAHPAYVIPQLGGRWHWLPRLRQGECALRPRRFDLHGDGRTLTTGYPYPVPAWADPRHDAGDMHAGALADDVPHVCRLCPCLTDGTGVHGMTRPSAGSSPHH